MSDSFATTWTAALQSPLSMEFSRQEYWGGLPFPPPGDLPDPRIKLMSSVSPAWQEPPGKPIIVKGSDSYLKYHPQRILIIELL